MSDRQRLNTNELMYLWIQTVRAPCPDWHGVQRFAEAVEDAVIARMSAPVEDDDADVPPAQPGFL